MIEGVCFPEGTTLEQIDAETWRLTMPMLTEEELRHFFRRTPQTCTWSLKATWRAEAS